MVGPSDIELRHEGTAIIKRGISEAGHAAIHNEARLLRLLSGAGVAPELLREEEDTTWQEYLGPGEPVRDEDRFRHGAMRLLWTLRAHEVCHGDLTGRNIVVRDDQPFAVDFVQSRLRGEGCPDKRPHSDGYWLWHFVAETPSLLHGSPDSSRMARRWLSIMGSLDGWAYARDGLVGRTLLDLGCYEGDFCAMAACEGMSAIGIDRDAGAVERGRLRWDDIGLLMLRVDNVIDRATQGAEVVLLLSTWAYIYRDYGRDGAMEFLGRAAASSGVLFFETQFAGDGPGPPFLRSDDDVARMLGAFGIPQRLAIIPVIGRDATRSIWRLTC